MDVLISPQINGYYRLLHQQKLYLEDPSFLHVTNAARRDSRHQLNVSLCLAKYACSFIKAHSFLLNYTIFLADWVLLWRWPVIFFPFIWFFFFFNCWKLAINLFLNKCSSPKGGSCVAYNFLPAWIRDIFLFSKFCLICQVTSKYVILEIFTYWLLAPLYGASTNYYYYVF